MKRLLMYCLFLVFFFISLKAFSDQSEGRLLRFPDVHDTRITFVYAGDLWTVGTEGGTARRLTSHPGLELFPKFSPDGSKIAFTGQYDGNFNVYVMPAEGGTPKQLTFTPDPTHMPERMGPNNEVITWLPDGKSILFLSRQNTYNDWFGHLFTIPVDGGLAVPLPLPKGGLTSFSSDGTKIAYNPIFRNFRTWKRYDGGLAQDVWTYDLVNKKSKRITDWKGTDSFPMWHGDTIYFNSDRDENRRFNLYAYSLTSGQTTKVTSFKDYDVLWPSLGGDKIVFENGGFLYLYSISGNENHKLTIMVNSDTVLSQPRWVDLQDYISGFSISPEGKRAIIEARGDIFTVPAKEGPTRNLTASSNADERYASWSPDAKWIAYVADQSGEDEIYVIGGDGRGQPVRVTTTGDCIKYAPVWSPDSHKLAWSDKNNKLYFVDIDSKKIQMIDSSNVFEIREYGWSPDSKWVAYSKPQENQFTTVELYSLATNQVTHLTDSFTNNHTPVFDPGGEYLYLLSERTYNEELGLFDFSFTNRNATRIYAVMLKADKPSPFAAKSDEAGEKKDDEKKPAEPPKTVDKKSDKKAVGEQKPEVPEAIKNFRIDLTGLSNRIVPVPIGADNITGLDASAEAVYYVTAPSQGLAGPIGSDTAKVHRYDLKEKKDVVILTPVDEWVLSSDHKQLAYHSAKIYGIVDSTKEGSKPGDGQLDLGKLQARVDYHQEWAEIFDEAWRQERDYFYSPKMNGVDWKKIRDLYAPLVPYVNNRYDLIYVIGEMIGELGNSHTYVGGGDMPDLKAVGEGYLGAYFELDSVSGYYRIKKIFPGDNSRDDYRSPLTEPGVVAHEGDYILSVDGKELKAPTSPYSMFQNKADQIVDLELNSSPSTRGSRHVAVKPIASEFSLHYLDWVDTNRAKVDKASEGKLGYIYLPDMDSEGLNEFVRQYFPQIRKQGLIIDARYNGGGFVDQLVLERLRRVLVGMGVSRNGGESTEPPQVFVGPMVCLANEFSASDGDIFPFYFQQYKLGPVIGKRTWGGVRGIRGYIRLLDGGYVTRPEFSLYDLKSQWVLENHGVTPDIEVENLPEDESQGVDAQLNRAIEYLMKEIQEHPRALPPRPSYDSGYPPGN